MAKKNKEAEAEQTNESGQPVKSPEERERNILKLRRTAKEVKMSAIIIRVIAMLIGLLVAILAVAYAISYFYDKFGSFTVKINKYDMVKQGLALSETPYYERTESRLHGDLVYDLTNISGEDLPENIDMINGSHKPAQLHGFIQRFADIQLFQNWMNRLVTSIHNRDAPGFCQCTLRQKLPHTIAVITRNIEYDAVWFGFIRN